MDQHDHLLCSKLVRPAITSTIPAPNTTTRAVKMSILALYNRIGSGKRGLPLIVQSRAIWITASFISAFTLAIILVS